MNQRDRLFVQREWVAWAAWVRDGRAFPNALGYGSSTPIGSILSGDIGGGVSSQSKVPTWFNGDNNVEKAEKVFSKLSNDAKRVLCMIFIARMREQMTADNLGVTRHQVRKRLNESYETLYLVISGEDRNGKERF